MRIGNWQAVSVLDGTFGLDGGSMFGIVPRPLWGKSHTADERNRISMALRPMVLCDGEGRKILVDAGIGPRFDAKQQKIYNYQPSGSGLVGALANVGIEPHEITDVIATHLHFDHVAGLLSLHEGRLRPTFPKAQVHVQEEAWSWAQAPTQWDQGSFFSGDFDIWERELNLTMLRGDTEVAPGVRVQVTYGHTPGHQIVLVGTGPDSLVFCADLIPTAAHLRLPYIMAYDQQPLVTLDEKKMLLAQAVEEDWILVFEHDPQLAACRLTESEGRVEPGERVCLNVHCASR